MVCTYCKGKTEITNSRHLARSNATWRRRRCLKCGALITSIEQADYSKTWMIYDAQKDKLSPFIRDRLFISIYDSLRHRRTAIQDANAITATIIAKLAKISSESQIDKTKLIATAHNCLKHFDRAAAVHYQAYYNQQI